MSTLESLDAGAPQTFKELGVSKRIDGALAGAGITVPTPIQSKVIPLANQRKDVIGIAQTGTGKTYAYGVPLLQWLNAHDKEMGLVLVPTRELADQVRETLMVIAWELHIKVLSLMGKTSESHQVELLRKLQPQLLIATTGRLKDLLNKGILTLDDVRIVVLDEADRLLDMGFRNDIDHILTHVPTKRQTMLFSATMSDEVSGIAASHLRDPLRVEVEPSGTVAENIQEELIVVDDQWHKLPMLKQLLVEHSGQILVFCNSRNRVSRVTEALYKSGHNVDEMHKGCEQSHRKRVLRTFLEGKLRILVATDVASRGLDTVDISLVVNFDLPRQNPEDYVHRIGRTARAGESGKAISITTPEEGDVISAIESILRREIPRVQLPEAERKAHAPD